ncbi:MAG: ABC transporter ATP-binding protein [Candidatus Saccharibacteria bacterium]|nr:ABC transporter ATP-binding protein [Candidatus Saccharibacteria bacterium]
MPKQKRITSSKKEIRREERQRKRALREAERKKANYPRMSLKSLWYTMKVYRKAVGPKRFILWGYTGYNAIVSPVSALLVGEATNRLLAAIDTQDFVPFLVIAILLLVIQLLRTLLSEVNGLISAVSWQDTYVYVSERIAEKYIEIPLATRESQEFADKFDRVKDFGASIASVNSNVIYIVSSVISIIAVVTSTTTVSPLVTIAVFLAAIPYSILSLRLAAKQRRNWREFTKDRRIAWAIQQKITNSNSALEIELNSLSKQLISQMVKARRRSQEQDVADIKSYFWPDLSSRTFEDVVSYAILIFVSFEIMIGKLSFGVFTSTRMLLSQLSDSITSLFANIASASESIVNATDYMEFMKTPARPTGDVLVSDIPKIEFRNVSFTYPRSEIKAVDNVSFKLEPGDSLAIVGENGAGKTTIIKLMIGAYQPDSGTILVNDIPLERIDRESYLEQIGALFQDYSRYEFATLGENVWYGDVTRPYSPRDIREALADAGLEDLEAKYPKGLNQVMAKDYDAESAADLSGGQWQRLSIARAFFRQPNVLILDEPTSAVDASSEYKIFKNILRKQQNKTTIIISHRFSTVRKAERIIVLDHGKIIEQGTHEELVAKGGTYKEMFEMQAEGYN